jgi:HlyD family secretion protein
VAAAEANLKVAWIEAPFDGTITDISALPGDLVNQNEPAFILNNLETLQIDLEISEIDINQIEVGQQVLITFDAIPVTEYEGVVIEVSIDGIESAGVVDFPVVVQITNPDDQIHLGMTASVEIIVVQQEEALLIPNQAIYVEEGVQVVYQLTNQGDLVAVPVVLGFSSNTYSEVLESGLVEGEQIVLNPSVILNQSNADDSFDQFREMGGENGEGPGAGPGQFFRGE